MTEKELATPFDFAEDEKKKEAHWRRDKNVRDVLIHLYEWHQLMIHFTDENMAGRETAFLPKPYTWKTYGAMNQFSMKSIRIPRWKTRRQCWRNPIRR